MSMRLALVQREAETEAVAVGADAAITPGKRVFTPLLLSDSSILNKEGINTQFRRSGGLPS